MSQHGFLSAWTCIYKRKFIENNNLKFKEGVIWEDSEFNTRAYMLTKDVIVFLMHCTTIYDVKTRLVI